MGYSFTARLVISAIIERDDIEDIPEDQEVCLYLKEKIDEKGYRYLLFPEGADIFSVIDTYEDEYEKNFERYYEENSNKFDFDSAGVVIVQTWLDSYKGQETEESDLFDIFDMRNLGVINVERLNISYSIKAGAD